MIKNNNRNGVDQRNYHPTRLIIAIKPPPAAIVIEK
jgi:hypothetical protein